jgi:signal transduction histidine kinase
MKRHKRQSEYRNHRESKAIQDCLHDLASLTRQMRSEQTGFAEAQGSQILEQLRALCAANAGLLALVSSPGPQMEQSRAPSSPLLPHLLAVQHIQPADALLVLQTVPLTHLAQPVVKDATCWFTAHLPTHLSQEIWIVLGWSPTSPGSRAALERARRVLPFVMDLASLVLTQALQDEQRWSRSTDREPAVALQEAHHHIMELFDTLGHEFRTPLATIKGYTDSLLRSFPRLTSEERQEFLQAIRDAENRLEELTTRLFDVAQLEGGAIHLDVQALDLPSLLRGTITRAQQWVPESLRDSITFHLQVRDADGHPAQNISLIRGHALHLRKVFEHLLENAIRFSPDGGRIDLIVRPAPSPLPAALPLTLRQLPTPLPYLEICVCDYGIGIPEAHLTRVFERFHRVDTSLTREGSGLGLGLTICQYLVALHQGHIWAESCPAGGSAFHLLLPVAEPAPLI